MLDLKEWQTKFTAQFPQKNPVFGEGEKHSPIVLVGEAPGGEEEAAGRPFVGKAGKNLNQFLAAISLPREQLYVTNVVKVRPTKASPKTGRPVNRPPSKEEIAFCLPLLRQELEEIGPKVVVTLGNVALQAVSGQEQNTVGALHGTAIPMGSFLLFPIYHPAAIIYNQSLRAVYEADLAALASLLAQPGIGLSR